MDKFLSVLTFLTPILFAAALGILARKKAILTAEQVLGLQQFVIRFCLPCVLFNSCFCAEISPESLGTMGMVVPLCLLGALWAFRARRGAFPHHNLPQLFCAKETGMLGIPLFIVLFGSAESYRMGVLDLAQGIISIPVLSILSASAGENPDPKQLAKKVLTSPMLLCSLLGLVLNLCGIRELLGGFGRILTETTSFLGQPVSAVMLFTVGYNFSLAKEDRRTVFKLSAIHFGMYALFGVIVQLMLCLIPNVDLLTRCVMAMYCTLPASYLAPSVGKTEKDFAVASGVCSLLTIPCLIVFCIIAVIAA